MALDLTEMNHQKYLIKVRAIRHKNMFDTFLCAYFMHKFLARKTNISNCWIFNSRKQLPWRETLKESKCASSVYPILQKPFPYFPQNNVFSFSYLSLLFLLTRGLDFSLWGTQETVPSPWITLLYIPSLSMILLCFQWFHVTCVNGPLEGSFSSKLFFISLPNSFSISATYTVDILAWVTGNSISIRQESQIAIYTWY